MIFSSSDIAKTFMLLCLKCYVDKEDNLMCYAYLNVYALYALHISHHQFYVLSKPLLAKLFAGRFLLVHPYPETNIFHMSPPYLLIRGISLPLLKVYYYCVILKCSKSSILCLWFSS